MRPPLNEEEVMLLAGMDQTSVGRAMLYQAEPKF
jgi:hypothetical protein